MDVPLVPLDSGNLPQDPGVVSKMRMKHQISAAEDLHTPSTQLPDEGTADHSASPEAFLRAVDKAVWVGSEGPGWMQGGSYLVVRRIRMALEHWDRTKVDFTVPELYTSVIKKGGLVDIQVDAATNTRRKGLIVATEPQINLTSRNLKVRALLQDGEGHPGAFVKVFVNAGVDKKAIMVPTSCIIPEDRNNQILIVKEGKAKVVNVTTGVREANNIEITKGLNAGDTVIVTGVLFARPQFPVNIRSVRSLDSATISQN